MIDQNTLHQLFEYNQATGQLIWKINKKKGKVGNVAGDIASDGYRRIGINGKSYKAHRLIWLYVYGVMPTKNLDHINGNKDDNRIHNLRECTTSQNAQNLSKISVKKNGRLRGCYYDKRKSKPWKASICVNGKSHFLGLFATEQEAHDAYCLAKTQYHTFSPIVR